MTLQKKAGDCPRADEHTKGTIGGGIWNPRNGEEPTGDVEEDVDAAGDGETGEENLPPQFVCGAEEADAGYDGGDDGDERQENDEDAPGLGHGVEGHEDGDDSDDDEIHEYGQAEMPAIDAHRSGGWIWITVMAHARNVMYRLHKVNNYLLKVSKMLLIWNEGHTRFCQKMCQRCLKYWKGFGPRISISLPRSAQSEKPRLLVHGIGRHHRHGGQCWPLVNLFCPVFRQTGSIMQNPSMTPDSELLRQYAEQGDQTAFAEVVRRQVDMVYSAALRVVNGDVHLAEDVTQTVFTALAHQAGALSHHPSIVGWLHTTARHAAIKAVRGEQRRRNREQKASVMQNLTSEVEINWELLRPALDEAVDQLPDFDREAVLLRYFKGLSHREVGEILGMTEDTARKRVERALEKLHAHFSRRGIRVSAILLAEVINTNSVSAAPVGLDVRVAGVSTAGAGVAAATGIFGKILSMSTKTKILLIVATLALAATITSVLYRQGSAPTPANAHAPATILSTKPAVPGVPTVSVQVEAPKVIAAQPKAEPAQAVSDVASEPSNADPRQSLDTAIPEAIRLLQAQDLVGFYNEFVQPEKPNVSAGQFDALVRQTPNFQQKIDELVQMLQSLQGLTPELDDSGKKATFKGIKQSNGVSIDMNFSKRDGLWYFEFGNYMKPPTE